MTCQARTHIQAYTDVCSHTLRLVQRLAGVTAENRVMFNELMEMKGNIRVLARVRPLVRACMQEGHGLSEFSIAGIELRELVN